MTKNLIEFPSEYQGWGKIGKHHYSFAKNLLNEFKDFEISYTKFTSDIWPSFKINGKIIMFDYQDFKSLNSNYKNVDICLKTQYTDKVKNYDNVYPWSQISFNDWDNYYNHLSKEIKYTAKTDIILNNQKSYGNAVDRRNTVKSILKKEYGSNVTIKHSLPQTDFFNLINKCLVYVHVPGYSNNMIDRAHVQMFGLGACVITTEIPNTFPNNKKPKPGIHYIKCKNDYSDLIELIEWCKSNREECVKIGNNAKQLFNESLTPKAIHKHLKKIIYDGK